MGSVVLAWTPEPSRQPLGMTKATKPWYGEQGPPFFLGVLKLEAKLVWPAGKASVLPLETSENLPPKGPGKSHEDNLSNDGEIFS